MTTALTFNETAVGLFPGQGAITGQAGMPWQSSPHWNLVEEISDAAEINVGDVLLNLDTADVVRTDRAQIATFALSMIAYHDLLATGVRPRYLLGHSLGEFSALAASGLLSVHDAARLISVRGRAMATAAEMQPGTMVALMGGDANVREPLESIDGAWIANINGEGQVVMSGTATAIAHILEVHKELGWRRATPLAVGGAFHSPLMQPAQDELDAALAQVTWHTTEHFLIANVDGLRHNDASTWQTLLSRQLTSPVEFLAATLALPTSVDTTIEMAPGNVLTGLTKRIRGFSVQHAPTTPEEVRKVQL